jgi:tetratricopeptide (TPR) repeat protein
LVYTLAVWLKQAGGDPEPLLRDTQRRRPWDFWPNYALAAALIGGKPGEAVGFFRAALVTRPQSPQVYDGLGHALLRQNRKSDALEAWRKAAELGPKSAAAFHNLGLLLLELGRPDESIAAYRRAIALEPKSTRAHFGLGSALHALGKTEEAAVAYRRAMELEPKGAAALHDLGNALEELGKTEEAAAAYRRAIALDPKFAAPHYGLGVQLHDLGRLEEAIAEVRQAMILDGEHVGLAPFTLGEYLRIAGRYGEAASTFRRLRERVKDDSDRVKEVDRGLALVERDAVLAPRLSAVLHGVDRPADAAERLEFARLACDRRLYAASARLYADALGIDPKLADDRQARHRYSAARSAALAGCGAGSDDSPPGEATRAALREQALGWLRAELAVWSKRVELGPAEGRSAVVQALRPWQVDTDLAGVRAPAALARLPAAERAAWQALWADVDALIRGAPAGSARAPDPSAGELPADPFAR